MFTEDTVFILGAGASWHYGYPTGEDLVKLVIDKADSFIKDINIKARHPTKTDYDRPVVKVPDEDIIIFDYNKDRNDIINNCGLLKDRLQASNAVVIDDFLSKQNEKIQEIGKFLIAWVILECEQKYTTEIHKGYSNNCNFNREKYKQSKQAQGGNAPEGQLKDFDDDWCRFVLHKITNDCEKKSEHSCEHTLQNNRVKFITFNYDISLELMLFRGLSASLGYFGQEEIDDFFLHGRFIHMYGKARQVSCRDFSPINIQWGDGKSPDFKKIYEASQWIKTIQGVDKDDDFSEVKKVIHQAQRIIILGFGFDDRNCDRLGFNNDFVSNSSCQSICFTNYGDSDKINKRVNKLFGLGDYFYRGGTNFIRRGTGVTSSDNPVRMSFERSTVDVYRALAEDIDL